MHTTHDSPGASAPASTPGGATQSRPVRRRFRRLLAIVGLPVAIVLLFGGYLLVKPIGMDGATSQPRPSATYDDAVARFAEVQRREAARSDIMPVCRSKLHTAGRRTARAIVLFHGYTNCPQQFEQLAERLVADGYNVYIPLAPEHGEVDRERSTLANLTSAELVDYANESLDIATGLGDRVTVLGLSGGGGVAAYLAQFRSDVDLAVPVAPYLGLPWAPDWLTPALVNLTDVLPPLAIGTTASAAPSGIYAPYASFDNNTRSAAAYMRLGQLVLADAARNPHRAARTLTVVNDADGTVNDGTIDLLTSRWRTLAPTATEEFRFPASLHLPHDLIGPDRVDQRTSVVYPRLLDLLGGP